MREILGTVFCVSYHRAEYVEECLKSYRNNIFSHKLKLVFIDNGSKENKKCIFDRYAIEGDVFERFDENNPIGRSNYAVNKYGEGEAYTILMDDDMLPFNGLEKRIKPIIDGRCQVVYTSLKNIGDEIGVKSRQKLLDKNRIVFGTMAYTPEAYNKVEGLNELLRYQCDYLFIELLRLNYDILYVSDVTLLYRYHTEAESTTQTKECRAKEHEIVKKILGSI